MTLDLSAVKTIGSGLARPEGVMALDDGSLYAADGYGRCARISRSGETSFIGSLGGAPNGICIDRRGNCIVANIGNGQVQALSPEGSHTVLVTEVGGKRMTSPNFPFIDSKERLWVTNSTFLENVDDALRKPSPDGCVIMMENGRPRIAAEGLYFANGLAIDREEKFLYVAETMKRRVTRFKIAGDGSLSGREVYGPDFLGKFGFPDGIAFDEAENLWVAFPAWNAIGYITPRHELAVYLEDPQVRVLNRPTNICFGWEGRRTAFIGSLGGTNIPYFEVPYPGMRLVHQKI